MRKSGWGILSNNWPNIGKLKSLHRMKGQPQPGQILLSVCIPSTPRSQLCFRMVDCSNCLAGCEAIHPPPHFKQTSNKLERQSFRLQTWEASSFESFKRSHAFLLRKHNSQTGYYPLALKVLLALRTRANLILLMKGSQFNFPHRP